MRVAPRSTKSATKSATKGKARGSKRTAITPAAPAVPVRRFDVVSVDGRVQIRRPASPAPASPAPTDRDDADRDDAPTDTADPLLVADLSFPDAIGLATRLIRDVMKQGAKHDPTVRVDFASERYAEIEWLSSGSQSARRRVSSTGSR